MVKVFISYSHKDEVWKDRLEVHLQGLVQQGDIELSVWDDRKIEGGEDWYPAIMKELGEASVAICLISDDFLASKFIIKEEIPVMVERREKDGMILLPVLVEPCVWKHIQWLKGIQMLPRDGKSLAEIDGEVNQTRALSEVAEYVYERVKDPKFRVAAAVPEWEEPERIDIERLPEKGMELFGRQEELEMLEKAWDSDETRVVSLVAWGGVGKSTLVNRWLELMGRENYRGARKVFGWSFYSQGTKERVTSADRFIAEGLKWFGDANPEEGSMWEKGRRLVDLIRKDRTLLILDGLEPLQWGATIEQGKIKDPVLSLVVTELAKENGGLCVITTREEVAELRRFAKGVEQRNLEQISKEAGGALLRIGGVKGSDAKREAASEEFGNHALAVNLLATYLHDIEGHHVKDAGGIGDLDIPEKEGRHPRRVIEAFEERFGEGAKVQVLRILGLFDRPAEMGAIEAVRGGDAIEGLTDELAGLTEGQLRDVLDELRGYKLIAKKSEHNPNIVDCHPLVREHFGEKLEAGNPDGWREAHGRLYEYYKGVPEKDQPDKLAEMEPLFAAVGHGCQAGRYQEVLHDVYWKRIVRREEYYVVHKLGAFGAFLAVLSGFFEEAWSRTVSELNERAQAVALAQAGFGLRALGWLKEAGEATKATLEKTEEQEDWKNAAIDTGNLSELYLTLGDVKAAVDYGRRGVEYADKSGDEFQRYSKRATLADALHQAGAIGEASGLFEEAEGMQKERQPRYPLLYSTSGFQYCDLILSGGGYEEVQERARQTLEWAELGGQGSLLDVAMDKVSLGLAYLLEAIANDGRERMDDGGGTRDDGGGTRDDGGGTRDEGRWAKTMAKARDWLGQAVDGLREAGSQDEIPRGLLGRAEYYRYGGEYEKAWVDLGEAREIAERGEMNLFLADYHLEAARVCLAEGESEGRSEEGKRDSGKGKKTSGSLPTACRDSGKGRSGDWKNKARGHWEEAKERVEKMGYHRRGPEVLLIEAEVLTLEGKKEDGKKRLEKAKARIDEMGCHRWDSEVERIKTVLRF